MHWQIHKDSTAHHAVAERLGRAAAGGDRDRLPTRSSPTRPRAPLPADIDEYLFAGFLRGERVEMVDCLTVPLQVPAHAQIVLEGYVEPGERAARGPVRRPHRLLHAGRAVPGAARRVHDDARDPIYHSIITSKPPQEDGPIGKATERIFLPLIKMHDPGHRRLRPAGSRACSTTA